MIAGAACPRLSLAPAVCHKEAPVIRLLFVLLTMLTCVACSGAADGDPRDSPATEEALASTVQRGPASELCGLFTPAEIGDAIGTAVEPGAVAAPGGTACQWDGTRDDEAYVQIQVIPGTEYWEPRRLTRGYEALSDVGEEAFVVPELGGWLAGVKTAARVTYVSMAGGTASRDTAVRLLRTAHERLERQTR